MVKRRKRLLAVCVAAALATPAAAASDAWKGTLVCTFPGGISAVQEEGVFKQSPAAALAFEVGSIDLDTQMASIVAKEGAAPEPLRIVRALNANHFIEVLMEGFLSLTTIYDPDGKTGLYPAVHSRHVGLLGQAVVAQYTGTCKAK
jgi:hypothetical protein